MCQSATVFTISESAFTYAQKVALDDACCDLVYAREDALGLERELIACNECHALGYCVPGFKALMRDDYMTWLSGAYWFVDTLFSWDDVA